MCFLLQAFLYMPVFALMCFLLQAFLYMPIFALMCFAAVSLWIPVPA